MGSDDDIAASLPRPPLPAPARREAAIAEALRRFDGAEPARGSEDRSSARPQPWWSPQSRPYAATLAGAFMVALIGLPWVWTSFDRSVPNGGRERRAGVETTAPDAAMADADVAGTDPAPAGPQANTQSPDVADKDPGGNPTELARAGPPPAPAREAPIGRSEEPVADSGAQETGEVVVTGSRIRHPNLESASPITVVGEDNITVTGTRLAHSAPRRRGDWNACTIDDPGRSVAACRKRAGPAAKGVSGRAADHVADGVASAWEGDLDSAMASFDRAIELAPRSSAAYLNRALAWRRRGDLDRALADLDRAVRFSPRGARFYYHRSLVLRQRGDTKRARADEERAVALDPRYAPLVGGGR
jgi:Tetratricopeptide repeat